MSNRIRFLLVLLLLYPSIRLAASLLEKTALPSSWNSWDNTWDIEVLVNHSLIVRIELAGHQVTIASVQQHLLFLLDEQFPEPGSYFTEVESWYTKSGPGRVLLLSPASPYFAIDSRSPALAPFFQSLPKDQERFVSQFRSSGGTFVKAGPLSSVAGFAYRGGLFVVPPYAAWTLVGLLLSPFMFSLLRLVRRLPRWWRNRCQDCGYDLRGNVSGACSECGRSVVRMRVPCP